MLPFRLLLLWLACNVVAFPHPHSQAYPTLPSREYVNEDTRADSYDFVIAGGGLAGLSLANRLSENFTVLVIEAGDIGPPDIDIPANAYYKSFMNSVYDYGFATVAQPSAGGRNIPWPRSKILGGSSATNGMYLTRPHKIDVNAWHDVISSQSDADQWTWDNIFVAMKNVEVFTPPTDISLRTAGMKWNTDSHGVNGLVHHTYPAYMVPVTQHWLPTLEAVGVTTNSDAYDGHTIGGFFSLSAINPSNWTRSDAKSAYIDPLPPRSNLHLLVKATVTGIVFDSDSSKGLNATAVEFSSGRDATKQSVGVRKEVIVSGGSVNSPQILQISGIGPSDVLTAAGVDIRLDLPGVGTHLQDHISTGVWYESKEDTQGNIYNSGSDFSKTPEFLSFVNSGVAYVNSTTLFGTGGMTAIQKAIEEDMIAFSNTIGTGSNETQVLQGFRTIYSTIADKIFPSEAPLVELLYSINVPGQIAVQAAIQHAFSQGRIYINSTSAFDPPVIDPQYLTHWADVVTMREGLKLARRIANTAPLNTILGNEIQPGPKVVTDDDWDNWLRSNSGTEFHPTSSCAMLPQNQGGVVDNKMKVYGTQNVRVVDASIFPINFGAHTMEPLYGTVEKAAEIIKRDYTSVPTNGGDGTQGGSSPATSPPPKNGVIKVADLSLLLWIPGPLFITLYALF